MNLDPHTVQSTDYKVDVINFAGAALNYSSAFSLYCVIIITSSFALGRAIF